MITSHNPVNNSSQNFGFKVKICESNGLVDMAKSRLFRNVSKRDIDKFEKCAENVLSDKTVILYPKMTRPMPYETYNIDFQIGNKNVEAILGYYPSELLTLLKNATSPYSKIHSRLFYDGAQSPETLAKVARFHETITTPPKRTNFHR